MALFHGVINSKALMKDTTLSMIVPSDDRKNIGFQGQPQLLILLHGAGGSNYTWSKYSSIERYTEPLSLIVLMPNIEFSFGFNMSNGLNYQSYLGEELLQWAEKTFGLKLDRETTTIAGQSMGGFAAIHTALAYPDKFGKCGVFSAPLALDEYLTGERPLGANMAHSKLVSMWKDSIFGKNEADLTEVSIFLCLYQLLHFFSCLAIVRVGCFLLGQKIGIRCIQCFDLRQLFKPVSSKAALAALCSVISSR